MSNYYQDKSPEEQALISARISEGKKRAWANKSEEEKRKWAENHSKILKSRSPEAKADSIRKRTETNRNKSEDERLKSTRRRSEAMKKAWQNKPKEELEAYSELQRKLKTSYDNITKQRIAKAITETWKTKTASMSKEELEAARQARSKRTKDWWNSLSEEEKQQWSERNRQLNMDRYANYTEEDHKNHSKRCEEAYHNLSDEQKRQLTEHRNATYRKNNSYGKSAIEESVYQYLVDKVDKIERQVCLNNYKYDFCVHYNNDVTYIEINGSYWHNYRPFIECDKHIKEYDLLRIKSERDSHIADIWRYYDVAKYNYCKSNNINFIRVYVDDKYVLEELCEDIISNLNLDLVTLFHPHQFKEV